MVEIDRVKWRICIEESTADQIFKGPVGELEHWEKALVNRQKIFGRNEHSVLLFVTLCFGRRNEGGKDRLVVCRKQGLGKLFPGHACQKGAVKKRREILPVKMNLYVFARKQFCNA